MRAWAIEILIALVSVPEVTIAADVCRSLQLTQLKSLLQIAEEQTISKKPQMPSAPDILVIVSTHGTGTTMLNDALDYHPCIIAIGEPFGKDEKLWSPSKTNPGHPVKSALFRNSNPDPAGTFTKLAAAVDKAVGTKVGLSPDLHLKAGNISSFFAAVKDASCNAYKLPDTCGGRCIFAHKLFPDYVENKRNHVKDYLSDPRVAVLHLIRNETDVAASNIRRFHSYAKAYERRDNLWHEFLSNIGTDAGNDRVWYEIHAEDIFRSPKAYITPLEKLFRDLHVYDKSFLGLVRDHINMKFEELEKSEHVSR